MTKRDFLSSTDLNRHELDDLLELAARAKGKSRSRLEEISSALNDTTTAIDARVDIVGSIIDLRATPTGPTTPTAPRFRYPSP